MNNTISHWLSPALKKRTPSPTDTRKPQLSSLSFALIGGSYDNI
ncbi:hypothetical protein AB4428_06205 [Vibrio lentus]